MDIYDRSRSKTGMKMNRGDILGNNQFQLATCVAIVNEGNKLLVTQRHPKKQMGGFWEFPGGAVEEGETSQLAATREIYEEVGIEINEDEIKYIETYCYEPFHLLVDIYIAFRDVETSRLILQDAEVVNVDIISIYEIEKRNSQKILTPFDFEISKIISRYLEYQN